MNKLQSQFIQSVSNEQADHLLVAYTAKQMEKKLHKKRRTRGGWYTDTCYDSDLKLMLQEHVDKRDWIDVINLAAMIIARKKLNIHHRLDIALGLD